jgi:hypothetical protein
MAASGDKLYTWPQIAEHLEVSLRTAMNYRKRYEDMPVHQIGGEKSPVWAFRSELDAWKAGRGAVRLCASDGSATIPDLPSVGDGTGADALGSVTPAPLVAVDSADSLSDREEGTARQGGSDGCQAPDVPRPTGPTLRRKILIGGILAFGVVLAAAIGVRLWRQREIASLSVEGPTLVAKDAAGKEMWRHVFDGGLYFGYHSEPARLAGACWIGDLDGDGHAEALFIYDAADRARKGSSIFCFSRTGDVKWVFKPGNVVRDSSGEILPPYHITALLVSFSAGPKRQARVALASGHPTDQACQLAFLDSSGRLVAEYWHPGILYLLAETRAGFGGAPRLIAGGVNNGEHRATLVVLDPFAMKGASTPSRMTDQKFRLLGMPESNEEAVILFPRSCLSRGEPYTRAWTLEAAEQTVLVRVKEGHDLSKPFIFYEFGPSLTLRRAFLSTEYRQEHARLERSGALSHSADADEAGLGRRLEIHRKAP